MDTPLPVGARTADRSSVQPGPLAAYLVQAGWLIVLTGTFAFAVAATPTLHTILQTTCPEQLCLPLTQPTAGSVELLQRLDVPLSLYAKAMVIVEWTYLLLVVAVAGTIVWKQPLDPGGVPVAFFFAVFAGETFLHALPAYRPELGLVPQISIFVKFAVAPAVLVRFPDGRWVPSWSRLVALAGLALAGVFAISGESMLGRLRVIGALALWSAVLYAVIWRYRFDSDTIRRQQTKWLLLAGGIFVVTVA